jgi:guanosine-3',5'-bis(diphosphate) 3'-pyrophosphohydrolase
MNIWNQEKYIKAWNFACTAHNGQHVPGTDLPYVNHFGLVAMEAMAAIASQIAKIESPDLLVLCALLHDTIEDTPVTDDDLKKEFGPDVASGVRALTKDKSLLTKAEQMDDSLKRIKKEPKEIWMVKLADRITNLQPPPNDWDTEKIRKYRNEASTILEALREANTWLAERLKRKIDQYRRYEWM